jgi:hypothetical protein
MFVDISVPISRNFNICWQNVLLEHMVSTVNTAVKHVLGSCVTALTECVHMVVLKVLMETVVI